MSKSRNLADLLDANGDVKVGALDNITVDDEVAIGATAPSSPTQGQVWYDTSVDLLKAYDGTNWNKVSPVIPTIASISGTIYETIGGNITITGTGFLSGNCDVEFSGSFTTAVVTVLASSDTSLVVAVPSAAYASTGTVTIKVTNGDNGQSSGSTFSVSALPTGGTRTISGGYVYHTFTSSGTFTNTIANLPVEYLIVAGGGGAAGGDYSTGAGGAGAGGLIQGSTTSAVTDFTVTVGAGGAGAAYRQAPGTAGNSSVFSVTALGGGHGAGYNSSYAHTGGSGGGGTYYAPNWSSNSGASGTTGQGNAGGSGTDSRTGGGGGGAGGAGGNASSTQAGHGGIGNGSYSVWATATSTGASGYYAGGGGGGASDWTDPPSGGRSAGNGGAGGGGNGGYSSGSNPPVVGQNGAANTGGGAGGTAHNGSSEAATAAVGASGGSGIVIIRYAI